MRIEPTGTCWCGCGEATVKGSFFKPGHDKRAESAISMTVYGGVAEMLHEHGFGPSGKNPKLELEQWRAKGHRSR